MAKFKVGDKVKIVKEDCCMFGSIGVVEKIDKFYHVRCNENYESLCLLETSIELIDAPEEDRQVTDIEFENETTAFKIGKTLVSLEELLLEKNKRYGDSALHPKKIFFKGEAENTILQRIDEKLMRVENSKELRKNDVADIMGYLVLLCIQKGWTDFKDLID